MRPALRAAAALFAAASVSACVTVSLSEQDVYLPQKGAGAPPPRLAVGGVEYQVEPHTIVSADGTRLAGALLRRPGADRTVLYFGGNLFTMQEDAAGVAAVLAPLNVDLMVMDYRGYGASGTGPLTTDAIMGDALAAFDHLARLPGMEPSKIVVHGHSLGSFMAGHVAAHRATAGVVLESSATTAEAYARSQVPFLARPFVRLDISESLRRQGNLQQMNRLDEPLLVLVGEKDEATPARFSRELFQASTLPPGRKRLAVVEDAGHNDVLHHPAGMRAYREFMALTR